MELYRKQYIYPQHPPPPKYIIIFYIFINFYSLVKKFNSWITDKTVLEIEISIPRPYS